MNSSNAFESGARKMIPAVLIYPERDKQILMLHRNSKAGDFHAGKWNGLGGKCEADESATAAAVRELSEESGLVCRKQDFVSLGVLHFPNFKPLKHEDWLVYLFRVPIAAGVSPWERGPEGDLRWIASEKVLDLNLWEGDRYFLPHVLAAKPVVGTFWYESGKLLRHELVVL